MLGTGAGHGGVAAGAPEPRRLARQGQAATRAAMLTRPGRVIRAILWRLFSHITFAPESAERIREAAACGTVVYVLRAVSYMDYLYFNYALLGHGLPLARFANGLSTSFFQPLGQVLLHLVRSLRRRPVPDDEEVLDHLVRDGQSALLFLRRPERQRRAVAAHFRGRFFETLLRAQREMERPIVLVPLMVIWGLTVVRRGEAGTGPLQAGRGVLDRLFGEREAPGWLRAVLQAIRYHRKSVVEVGEAVDLQRFIASADQAAGDDLLVRQLRWELSGRIERERRLVLGPPRKTRSRVKEEVLRSRFLVEAQRSSAAEQGIPEEASRRLAAAFLDKIAADASPRRFELLRLVTQLLFTRLYSAEVDEAGVERVREAARHRPIVLCPSHRSYCDFLVLSWAFHRRGIVPPHIAATEDLDFWPIGWVLRGGGAFFIRRGSRGDPLYKATLRAYMRKLMREGFAVEFFIEGKRSRIGKALQPKLGLLGMLARDAIEGGERPLLVPISIGYDKVLEVGSHAREQEGGEKRPEGLRSLLRAGRVLGSRYGHINVQFDEPFDLLEALREAGAGDVAAAGRDEDAWRAAVEKVGRRVVYCLDRATAVTATSLVAAALLAAGRRGVARSDLVAHVRLLAGRARHAGARFTQALEDASRPDQLRMEAVEQALALFAEDKDVEAVGGGPDPICVVPDDRRIRLAFYKNNSVHYFVPESIVAHAALALMAGGSSEIARDELRRKTLELSRLLKLEFHYRVGATFADLFDHTLGKLLEAGWLTEIEEAHLKLRPGGRGPLALLAGLTRELIEAYWAAARALGDAPWPLSQRDLLRHIGQTVQRLYYCGEITRREACARDSLANAIAWFVQQGWLVQSPGPARKGGEPLPWLALATDHQGRLPELASSVAFYLAGTRR